jgi:hypothetical protein
MLQLSAAFLIALSWLIPNHYPPWTSFYNESCMAIALVLLTVRAMTRPQPSTVPAVAWFVAAIAAIPWLQLLLGQLFYSGDAWVTTLYLAGLAIAVTVGFVEGAANLRSFSGLVAGAVTAGALASSFLAIAQIFPGLEIGIWTEDSLSGMRASANLAQPNNLATLIGFGALSVLLLFEQKRVSATMAVVMTLVLLVGSALTQSRTALLYGPAACAGMLLLSWRKQVTFRTHWVAVAAVSVAQWLATWALPKLQSAMLLTATWSAGSRGVESVRFRMWAMLLDALSISPWTGYGWLQGGAAELATVDRRPPVGELWLHSHNLFLDLLVWCGYPVGVVLSILVVYWFVSRWLGVRSVESAVGMFLIAVLGLHAMLELPHHYAYFLIPAGLWAGMIESERRAPGWGGKRAMRVLAVVGLVMLIGIWRDYFVIEEEFRTVRFEYVNIGPAANDRYAPPAPLLSGLTAYLRVSRTPYDAPLSKDDLAEFQRVVSRFPYATLMARYAAALAINHREAEAREIFEKIRHINGDYGYSGQRKALIKYANERAPQLREFAQSLPN